MAPRQLIEEDVFGNPLEIGFLVVIAASSRYAHSPQFALYDGCTAKTFRYKALGAAYDYQSGSYRNKIYKTNLSSSRGGRASCLLISPTVLTEKELEDIGRTGIQAIQHKGYV